MTDFLGKKVWIIGASSGIGAATAQELALRGATVIVSARRADALDALRRQLPAPKVGEHHAVALDVSDHKAFLAAAVSVQQRVGRIDSVIYMAGTYQPSTVAKISHDDVRRIVDVNLVGAFSCVAAVLPILRGQGSGQIALCGSVAGYRGLPNSQPYGATKAAIINLAETLRAEESRKGIDVRLISPGFVKTPMTDQNDFSMPMMITAEEAARSLVNQLEGQSFEITFPKKFTTLMKILRLLPDRLFFATMRRLG